MRGPDRYRAIIIPTLLYASESWVITAKDEKALEAFYHSCTRSILGITRKQQFNQYISTQTILHKLHLPPITTLLDQNCLRWAGHVARMPYTRLPRIMLNSWTSKSRPRGAPKLTYARFLHKVLRRNNIDPRTWHLKAQNKDLWKKMIKSH